MRTKLSNARLEAGFSTHREIADKLGVSRAHYTHLEIGTRNPTLSLAIKIAELLNKTLDEIFLPGDVPLCDKEEPTSTNKAG